MEDEKLDLHQQLELDKIKKRLDIFYKYLIDKSLARDYHPGQMELFNTFYNRKDLRCLREYDHRFINFALLNYPMETRTEIYELFKKEGVADKIRIENPKLNERQKSEIDRLKKWFDIFYYYISSTPYVRPFDHELKGILDRDFQNNNLEAIRATVKDIKSNYEEDYPTKLVQDLRRLFKEQLGEDYEKEEQKVKKKIEKLIEKGKIRTLSEYAFALDWVEANYQEDAKLETVKALNYLLADYHRRQDEKDKKKK